MRKPISKKLRFEVFARDSFTCQYCGKKAPDVVLEVDHINPVCKKGNNDKLNLITSCFDCNRGKVEKTISERAELDKQREHLELLNTKREQMTQLIGWKKKLLSLEDDKIKEIENVFKRKFNKTFSDIGIEKIRAVLKKTDFDIALNLAEKYTIDGDIDSWFAKFPKVCYIYQQERDFPYKFYTNKVLTFVRFSLKNHNIITHNKLKKYLDKIFSSRKDDECKEILKEFRCSYDLDELFEKIEFQLEIM